MNNLESNKVGNKNNNMKEGSGDGDNKNEEREDPGVVENENESNNDKKILKKKRKRWVRKRNDVAEGTRDDLVNEVEGSSVGGTEATDSVTVVNSVCLVPFHMNVPQLRGWDFLGDRKISRKSSHVPRHAHSVARDKKSSGKSSDVPR